MNADSPKQKNMKQPVQKEEPFRKHLKGESEKKRTPRQNARYRM